MQAARSYSALIEKLQEWLSDYHYTEYKEDTISGTGTLHLIMTPRRGMVRYVCAVSEIPGQFVSVKQTKTLFRKIRTHLSAQLTPFPWPKGVGTYLVLFCSHELYVRLDGHVGDFYDRTGIHVTVMLGTIFIDRDRFQSSAEATWGLFYSGKHFVEIRRAVREWCKQQRRLS